MLKEYHLILYHEITKKEQIPDFYVLPQKSIVLEVKFYELVTCDKINDYNLGFTWRFPRVIKVRFDKDINECNTIKMYIFY